MSKKQGRNLSTLLCHLGSHPEKQLGAVNAPVYRASTIIVPDVPTLLRMQELQYEQNQIYYGAYGGGSTVPLSDAIAALEGGYGTVLFSTGLAAVTLALMTWLKAGDHVLLTEGIYGPSHNFCFSVLKRFGVEVSTYDPLIGSGIAKFMRPNTRIVFMESPSSLTFEIQDVPAISKVAHEHGAIAMLDNTWATPLFFPPFEHGVDVSIMALTKYIAGHSDLVMGSVTVNSAELFRQLKKCTTEFGDVPGADDCYLTLRGIRTLELRLRHQEKSALKVAKWMQQRSEVQQVLYPALPDDPGYEIWKRDFLGASSLFGVWLDTEDSKAVDKMLQGYELFKIGMSWGGFESLSYPAYCREDYVAVKSKKGSLLVRYHVGLEDPDDLIADLEKGFAQLKKATLKAS